MASFPNLFYTACFTAFLMLLLGESGIRSVQAHVLKRSVPLTNEFKRFSLFGLPTDSDSQWEFAQVKFVTQLRHRRDLTERKFHIIHVHRPASNSTMELHLVKKSLTYKSFNMVVSEEGHRTVLSGSESMSECQWSGISSSDPEGRAALTTCGHETGGFSGLIISSEGQFMIQPHTGSSPDVHIEGTMTITHIIVRVNGTVLTGAEEGSTPHSDVLHMPEDEYEKASQEEAARYAKYFNQTHNSTETNAEATDEDTEEQDDEVDSNLVISEASKETVSGFLVQSLAAKTKKGKKGKKDSAKAGKPTAKPAAVSSSSNKHTVEIAVFVDPELYKILQSRYPSDTMNKIKEYIMTIVNAMDMLYQQPSLGNNLAFKLVHLEILKAWPNEIKHQQGELLPYLTTFCDYAGDLNEGTSLWDHALMVTGLDIKEGSVTGVAGVAWAGTMCMKYRSCSLSEGTNFGLVFIITHEIGHSVGMDHDGDQKSTGKSCNGNKHIMSPSTGAGKSTWSTCSAQNLRDFLEHGTNSPKSKKGHRPLCLTIPSSQAGAINYASSTKPGQKYNGAAQCGAYGSGVKPSPLRNKAICNMLYCNMPGRGDFMAHPALEGTTCATGKVCKHGQCM